MAMVRQNFLVELEALADRSEQLHRQCRPRLRYLPQRTHQLHKFLRAAAVPHQTQSRRGRLHLKGHRQPKTPTHASRLICVSSRRGGIKSRPRQPRSACSRSSKRQAQLLDQAETPLLP